MSSMEIDLPVTGYNGSNNGTANHSPASNATVHFNAVTEVKAFSVPSTHGSAAASGEAQRPKHKARRRARIPLKINVAGGEGAPNGEGGSPTAAFHLLQQGAGKPLSPSKMKKIADKDRHSRSGRRGMPKKGM